MVKLIGILVLVVYIGGIWKFSQGYRNTNFNRSLPTRLVLSLLWPVLLTVPSFRQNFRRALKGRN